MKFTTFVITAAIILATSGPVLAHCGTCGIGDAKATEEKSAEGAHMMENKTCICGMKLSEETGKTTHVEHNGKTYHFCSLKCADHFKQNPDETIKQLSAEPAHE
jgi:YHS domain-containing protein